jgi:hypothetical protein
MDCPPVPGPQAGPGAHVHARDARHGRSRALNFNLAVTLQETAQATPDRAAAVYAGGQLPKNSLGKVLKDQLIPREKQGAIAGHGGKDGSWNA